MQLLLREHSSEEGWQIVPASQRVTLETWLASTSKVTKMRFHLDQPNPGFGDAKLIEKLVGDTNVASTILEFQNPDGIAVDTVSPGSVIKQDIDYVRKTYGYVSTVGVSKAGEKVTYSSKHDTTENIVEIGEVDEHGEVGSAALIAQTAYVEENE
jgi:hypothetical protein